MNRLLDVFKVQNRSGFQNQNRIQNQKNTKPRRYRRCPFVNQDRISNSRQNYCAKTEDFVLPKGISNKNNVIYQNNDKYLYQNRIHSMSLQMNSSSKTGPNFDRMEPTS